MITASLTPNDPSLPDEWGLDQPSDADIDAKTAWNTTTGSPSVTVAVIDSGIDLDHPDLAANIWTNPGEIAGNGIDDDGDGYVDDVHGWDFVDDDNLPDDQYGHGTHVAGTVAAAGNNGIGVVGVAYTSTVMPLRILDANGAGYVSDAIRALDFAARHGIRISNNSWGYVGGASQVLSDAIEAAGDAGQLVVVASGNQGADIDQVPDYPAAYDLPNILTVAATDQDDQLALFSNVGAIAVDIAAPGDGILSTVPSGYGYSSGTSMASPHVAGVAALVLSVHPTWTTAQIRDRILQTARPIASLEGVVATGGMVNAAAAVGGAVNLAPVVTITKPTSGTSVLRGTKVTFTATAVDPEQGNVALVDQLGVEPAGRDRGGRLVLARRPRGGHARHRRDRPRRRPPHATRGDPAAGRAGGPRDRRAGRSAHAGDRRLGRRNPGARLGRAGDGRRRQPPARLGLVAGGRHEVGRGPDARRRRGGGRDRAGRRRARLVEPGRVPRYRDHRRHR